MRGDTTHASVTPSSLDGMTIFRFAHMWRDSSTGGIEGYLHNLNRALLARHDLHILQMYLAPEGGELRIERERVGQGEIDWIPSVYRPPSSEGRSTAARLWRALMNHGKTEVHVNHDLLLATLENTRVDLAVFHWLSDDSEQVMDGLSRRNVPCAVVHHFQNQRLRHRRIRKQVSRAVAVGGVTGVGVPRYIETRFTNLSDAVDTDFFRPDAATPAATGAPIFLLPSRVYREKGHLDALYALESLGRCCLGARLVFAGKVEDESFLRHLQQAALRCGLQDRIVVLGQVSPRELRDWYAASIAVILPSYDEGLGRVLLEAQAMGKPVLAYDAGGVSEALVHGQTGWLVTVGDVLELAHRMEQLLSGGQLRREMAPLARHFVTTNFSLAALARRHEEFYARAAFRTESSCARATRPATVRRERTVVP